MDKAEVRRTEVMRHFVAAIAEVQQTKPVVAITGSAALHMMFSHSVEIIPKDLDLVLLDANRRSFDSVASAAALLVKERRPDLQLTVNNRNELTFNGGDGFPDLIEIDIHAHEPDQRFGILRLPNGIAIPTFTPESTIARKIQALFRADGDPIKHAGNLVTYSALPVNWQAVASETQALLASQHDPITTDAEMRTRLHLIASGPAAAIPRHRITLGAAIGHLAKIGMIPESTAKSFTAAGLTP